MLALLRSTLATPLAPARGLARSLPLAGVPEISQYNKTGILEPDHS
jgi:hypothetical protein